MKKGFTVLELLLTITVIFLLISLSLQTYSNAKRQAQIAACQIHKKQVDMLRNMPEYNVTKLEPETSTYLASGEIIPTGNDTEEKQYEKDGPDPVVNGASPSHELSMGEGG